jgi:protein TonB
MSAINKMRRSFAPVALAVAVACALGACKKDDAAADAGAAAAQQAPAPTPESVVSATVTAMSPEQLRDEASKAYGENRLYAPAGNNAMEYYLALRDKQPADAGASSALTDLLPMTVIATEQGIAREDFADAKRLAALIEKADAKHPALSRLKAAIASSETAAAARVESQKLTAEEEAKRQEELAKKREEDQRKLQEQQKQQAAAQAPAAATPAAPAAAAAEAERQREAAAEAERQRAAAAAAEQQRQQAAAQQPAAQPARAASSELRPISNPGPRYPQAAQRAGAGGSVQVEFTVNTDGSVGGVRAVSSDGPRQFQRDFEREALAAVKRWRFQPVSEATTTRRTIAFQQ